MVQELLKACCKRKKWESWSIPKGFFIISKKKSEAMFMWNWYQESRAPNSPSNIVVLHSPLSINVSVTTYDHQMIVSPPYLFINRWRKLNALYAFPMPWGSYTTKNCFSVSFHFWKLMFQRVYTSIWDTLYVN